CLLSSVSYITSEPMQVIGSLVVLIVVSILAAGCGGSSPDTTTTVASMTDGSDVVFGRGSVPDTVPDSFPIPDGAVVGATLVDADRGLTEMILTFPTAVDAVVTYYEKNLPARGYKITRSDGTGSDRAIEFDGEGIDGVIRLKVGGSGVSAASVRLTVA
ncbi:MAG: hypothetical protein U9N79_00680, partial [Actinomycetota bacterium]|nr:hypothetical protein [Actinomycetota bacterium]